MEPQNSQTNQIIEHITLKKLLIEMNAAMRLFYFAWLCVDNVIRISREPIWSTARIKYGMRMSKSDLIYMIRVYTWRGGSGGTSKYLSIIEDDATPVIYSTDYFLNF